MESVEAVLGWAAEASADYQRLHPWPAGIDTSFLFQDFQLYFVHVTMSEMPLG